MSMRSLSFVGSSQHGRNKRTCMPRNCVGQLVMISRSHVRYLYKFLPILFHLKKLFFSVRFCSTSLFPFPQQFIFYRIFQSVSIFFFASGLKLMYFSSHRSKCCRSFGFIKRFDEYTGKHWVRVTTLVSSSI